MAGVETNLVQVALDSTNKFIVVAFQGTQIKGSPLDVITDLVSFSYTRHNSILRVVTNLDLGLGHHPKRYSLMWESKYIVSYFITPE